MVRILMLKLKTSYTNRLVYNEHGNVSCAKKSFIEKYYEHFLFKKGNASSYFFFF